MTAERVFVMPDLGEGLEEGEISAWLVNEGDDVALNQPLVEVETAKAAVEIPSPFSGRVVRLHGAAGDTISVGAPLVTFDVAAAEGGGAVPGGEETPSEADSPAAAPDHARAPVGVHAETGGPVAATPAVRRLAKDLGVELGSVAGSGQGGRVTATDVARAAGAGRAPGAAGADSAAGPPIGPDTDTVPITPIRRAIAERLTRVAAIPQVTTFRTVDCTHLDAYRRELKVSPLPILIAALARVIADHPLLNASWATDVILVHRSVHVGVATDTERGLIVPVVRNVQDQGISAIAKEVGRLAEEARDGSLGAGAVSGATISVSNTGSYGSEAGTPLLNPGNAVTLAFGVIRPRALVVEGDVAARPAATLSLTFDHRVLDGAAAGRALTDLVAFLQDADRLRHLPR